MKNKHLELFIEICRNFSILLVCLHDIFCNKQSPEWVIDMKPKHTKGTETVKDCAENAGKYFENYMFFIFFKYLQ